MRRFLAVVPLVFMLTSAVLGQDKAPPPTPEQVADQVMAAAKSEPPAEISGLAALDDPDPWLVADELCARGETDAAAAFAAASPRKDVERLAAYVASRRGKSPDAASRKALAALNSALVAKDAAAALSAASDKDPSDDPVIAIRLAHGRAIAQGLLQRAEEAGRELCAAAQAAEKLGWVRRGNNLWFDGGESAFRRGDARSAVEAWGRCLSLAETRDDHTMKLRTLDRLASAHERLGALDAAVDARKRAVAIAEGAGDKRSAGANLRHLGRLNRTAGRLAEALETDEKARAVLEEAGAEDELAVCLLETGHVHFMRRDSARAFGAYERALSLYERLGMRAGAATVLCSMGALHGMLGEYAAALDHLERAAAVLEELGDDQNLAATLQNIGVAEGRLGRPERALASDQRALSIYEKLGDRRGIAAVISSIASDYQRMREFSKALEFNERALAMFDELGDRRLTAQTITNIAGIHVELGEFAKALPVLEGRALKLAEEMGDREQVARVHGTIAALYGRSRNHEKAIEHAQAQLAIADEICAHDEALNALEILTTSYLRSQRFSESVGTARRAIDEITFFARGIGDEGQTTAKGQFHSVYMNGAFSAANLDDAASVSFFLESGRAGTLLETLRGREALRAAAIPEPLRNAESAARAAETAAVAASRKALESKSVPAITASRKGVDAARDALREVIARIQREAKAAAGVFCPGVDSAATIRSRLTDGDLLVLFGIFEGDSIALALNRDEARIVVLGKTAAIEAACSALVASDATTDPAAAVAALRKLVTDPLALDAKVTRILVSPDGALSYVPFALLLPEHEVCYVPSGTTYGLLLEDKDKRGEGVLALGDPDYGTKSEPSEAVAMRGGWKLDRLPATGVEAKAVGDVVLVAKDATEAGLRGALAKRPRWRAVHLACHGLVDAERPTLSALAVTPAGEDDGFLTALEVFESKVPADLVVLSACETGKGKVVKAEGIVGLTRAFMFAGAPRVIVSLWKVDDEATAALMSKFYEGFKKGVPAARALRDAQAFVRSQAKWKHPFYWAAWSLWGLPE